MSTVKVILVKRVKLTATHERDGKKLDRYSLSEMNGDHCIMNVPHGEACPVKEGDIVQAESFITHSGNEMFVFRFNMNDKTKQAEVAKKAEASLNVNLDFQMQLSMTRQLAQAKRVNVTSAAPVDAAALEI